MTDSEILAYGTLRRATKGNDMKYTFRGGFHVEEHKNTTACAIMPLRAPQKVFLPMQMHIGAPCTPCVKVGDRVLRGQKIGDGVFGQSITDPCIGWEKTEKLVLEIADLL